MSPRYHQASYYWEMGDYNKSYDVISSYLKKRTGVDMFSVDQNFFLFNDRSFWSFLERLLSNTNRRGPFCSAFSLLWDDYPCHHLLAMLIKKDFTEPSMVESLGMTQFGFEIPIENFNEIIDALVISANRGFLTKINQKTAFDGRIHLNFADLNDEIKVLKWQNRKNQFLSIEAKLEEIGEIPWDKIVQSDHNRICSTFLFEAFGDFQREMMPNYIITTGCLQMNLDWKAAVEQSIQQILISSTNEELEKLVMFSAQIIHRTIQGREWLELLLSYFNDFDENKFYELYS